MGPDQQQQTARKPRRLKIDRPPSQAILCTLTHRALAYLDRRSHSPWFPLLVGLCAFLGTITLTRPTEWLVAISVVMNRSRWIAISLWAVAGANLASLGLYLAFHHLGWELLIEWYPDIARSKFWAYSTRYLSEYGSVALFVLIASPSPIPKTPALAFVAIYRMPIYEVVLAIGLGELLRNVVYAYLVSRFPRRFVHLYLNAGGTTDGPSPTKSRH
jgi:uncharacterized membrane protein YdjX (TVP38/TMEM64 family)